MFRKYEERLVGVLGLKGHPIAVSYTMAPAKEAIQTKFWVCEAISKAREGREVVLTERSSACMAGAWQLGLTRAPTGEDYKALARFLVEGEKLCASYAAMFRMHSLCTPAPFGMGDCVIIRPLQRATAAPDAVVFVVNPEQASRILTLATFETGVPPRIEMFGPTCHQVIGYPVATGQINVTVMDITTRKQYRPDELFVTIPGNLLPSVITAIEKSTAGIAPFEVPAGLTRNNLPTWDYSKPIRAKPKARRK